MGKPPRRLTDIVGCSETEVLASLYFFVKLVSVCAISFCERSRSEGSTNDKRANPRLTDPALKPGEVTI